MSASVRLYIYRKKKKIEKLVNAMSPTYYYLDHWLSVGPTDDLRKLCSEIVADFDTKYLEKSRKAYRELMETLQKTKN